MKKFAFAALAALAVSAAPASAADLIAKARPMAAPPPPAWDIAFGSAIATQGVFRGVSQTAEQPGALVYFEPRYNINKDTQLYVGLAGASISFPNRAAAEIDFYGGIRPTFGKLGLDFGFIYYYYPGGTCFHANPAFGGDCAINGALPNNGNFAKADMSFWEIYAKANYAVTDAFSVGAQIFYSDSVMNSGAEGVFVSGNAKYTFPAMSNGNQFYVSGEVGYWDIGTSDSFYGLTGVVGGAGIDYFNYTTWNLGFGWTWKVFTFDVRYHDTDMNKGDCNAFTSDHTASGALTSVTAINPGGFSSKWCDSRVVAKLSADLTLNTNVK